MAEEYDILARRSTAEVLQAEFRAIHGAWKELSTAKTDAIKSSVPAGDQAMHPNEVAALAEYYENVHALTDAGQTAVCLSGGGIRSAAFGLGILQGLARRDILSGTHYISTVSGGGYIGSWLVAWANRHATRASPGVSFHELEAAIANRPAYSPVEPAPLRWLRANQKFLTPRRGIGSPDTWAAIASFLRDLILNWLVFVPIIGAVLLVPYVLEFLLQWWGLTAKSCGSSLAWFLSPLLTTLGAHATRPTCWQGWLDSAGALMVMLGITVATCNRRALHGDIDEGGFRRFVLWPVITGATILLMEICAWGDHPSWQRLVQWVILVPASFLAARAAAYVYSLVVRGLRHVRLLRSEQMGLVWELSGLVVSGMVTGALIWSGLWLHSSVASSQVLARDFAILGVPWLLCTFVLGQIAYAGLTSFAPSAERDREWLARASGWYLAVAVLWFGGMGIVLLVPRCVNWRMLHALRAHDEKLETTYADFRNEVLAPDFYSAVAAHRWWLFGASAGTGGLTLATSLSSVTKATTAIAAVRQRLSTSVLLQVVAAIFLLCTTVLLAKASVQLLLLLPIDIQVVRNLNLTDVISITQTQHALLVMAAVVVCLLRYELVRIALHQRQPVLASRALPRSSRANLFRRIQP